MTPDDVYELTGAQDPRLSPDGRTVAFTVWSVDREAKDYRSAVWLVPADGSGPARRFTAGDKRDGSPRWSGDGTRIAFTSTRADKASQLYVMPVDGGEPVKLTALDEDVTSVAWSPEGARIAFACRVRDEAYAETEERLRRPRRLTRLRYKLDNVGFIGDRPTHVFVVPSDGSAPPRRLTDGDHENTAPAWSPDGTRIVFASGRHEDWDVEPLQDFFVVDADGGDPRKLTATDGWYDAPSWSPDGASIAARFTPGVWDQPRHGQIAIVDSATGERRLLTEALDRNCSPYPEIREPIWDGDAVLFAVDDRGNTHVYRAVADGSKDPEPIVGGEIAVDSFDVSAGRVVHAASAPTHTSEVFAGERALTDVGSSFTSSRELSPYERFTATSADGSEVDGWIVRPTGLAEGRSYPVIVNVHGGPFTQYGNRFFDEFQVYAAAGYAVVFSNPRGSSGYSEAWGRAIRGPSAGGAGWGSVDYEDVIAITEEALRQFPFCDPDRVGVMGGSYGGFMTSWIVGHTNRFTAAISERAVNSFYSEWGSSDVGWSFREYVGSYLFEDVESYLKMSPATYAPNIETPLLILHSENDLRCPIEQAEHLFHTLRVLRKDVEFVRFPAESHELSRSGSPPHRVMRFETILDWWARRLTAGA